MSAAAVGIALLVAAATLALGATTPTGLAAAGSWLVIVGLVFEHPA